MNTLAIEQTRTLMASVNSSSSSATSSSSAGRDCSDQVVPARAETSVPNVIHVAEDEEASFAYDDNISFITDSDSDSQRNKSGSRDGRLTLRDIRKLVTTKMATCRSHHEGPPLHVLWKEFKRRAPRDVGLSPFLLELARFTRLESCSVCNYGTKIPFRFSWAHGCATLFARVPDFVTKYAPSQMEFRSDAEWAYMIYDIHYLYNWCVRRRYYNYNPDLEHGLSALRRFQLLRIPADIEGLLIAQFWTRMEQIMSPLYVRCVAAEKNHPSAEDSCAYYDDNDEWVVTHVSKFGWHLKARQNEIRRFLATPLELARVGHRGMRFSGLNLARRGRFWAPLLNLVAPLTVHPSTSLFTAPRFS